MTKQLHPLTELLLFGDIDEMPWADALGDAINPDLVEDREAEIRVACATVVQACIDGYLHRGGYKWDPKIHQLSERIDILP